MRERILSVHSSVIKLLIARERELAQDGDGSKALMDATLPMNRNQLSRPSTSACVMRPKTYGANTDAIRTLTAKVIEPAQFMDGARELVDANHCIRNKLIT